MEITNSYQNIHNGSQPQMSKCLLFFIGIFEINQIVSLDVLFFISFWIHSKFAEFRVGEELTEFLHLFRILRS